MAVGTARKCHGVQTHPFWKSQVWVRLYGYSRSQEDTGDKRKWLEMSPPANRKVREIPEPAETANVERSCKQEAAWGKESTPCHDGEGDVITGSQKCHQYLLWLCLGSQSLVLQTTNGAGAHRRTGEEGGSVPSLWLHSCFGNTWRN